MNAFDVFFTDSMTVWRTRDVLSPENASVTKTQDVLIGETLPCHLSQEPPGLEKLLEHNKAQAVMKLFFSASLEVCEGDTVEVVKNGLTAGARQTYRFTCAKPVPALGGCMEAVVYG